MKSFNKRRLMISGVLFLLIIVFLIIISLDIFTYSKYESRVTSQNSITTALYLLDDSYQTINVKLPDVVPGNYQYKYSFSVSNFKDDLHCDTNLKYHIHIRTTTNMEIVYQLFDTLDVDHAQPLTTTTSISPDYDGTFFYNMITDDETMLYSENKTDNYTILFTFPAATFINAQYSGIAELIEINIESSQIIASDT